MDADKTTIIVGPPGTGKTTRLVGHPEENFAEMGIVEEALRNGIKPYEIAFISFTKKAAEEGKTRTCDKFHLKPEDLPHFRTIHSFAFKYLGMRRDQTVSWSHLRELGKMLGLDFKGRGQVAEDDVYGMGVADRMLFLEGLARNAKMSLKQVWEDAAEDDIDWHEFERFARSLASFKKNRMLYDFTDMLERFCLISASTLPRFKILIVDEAQDLSALQWDAVDLLAKNADKVYVAGDDDQCHPPGTKILTSDNGYIKIDQLVRDRDSLVYWRRDTHCFHGFNQEKGEFDVGKRRFIGKLTAVEVNGEDSVEFTPDHRLIVRLTNQTQDWRCVYLMQKGEHFRVGQCQVFGPENQMHLAVRMRQEKADGCWILLLSKDEEEILVKEQFIAAKFNLPQICSSSLLANRVFNGLDTAASAKQCLDEFNLLMEKPWITPKRAHQKAGGTSIMDMEACNLISEIMLLPQISLLNKVAPCRWVPFITSKRAYNGEVFSLDVKRFHTYVAGSIGVHNCIYRWSGADVDRFVSLEGSVHVLNQSFRIPSSVFELAESLTARISKRRPKTWQSRTEVGEVNWFGDVEEVDLTKGQWLLLARNGYMLDKLEDWCLIQGLSFHSVNKDPLKSPALAAIKTWEMLRKGRDDSAEHVIEVLRYMSPNSVPSALMKQLKSDKESRQYCLPDLIKLGLGTQAIWHEALTKIPAQERDFFLAARRRGEPLLKEPRINISTIHGSKGGQADNVLLLTDMSYRCHTNMQNNLDDELRVWYVAATRCRKTLNLIMPKTNLSFDI